MNKKLYLVGCKIPDDENGWYFNGIFDDLATARKNVLADNYFVAKVYLNKKIPKKMLNWKTGSEFEYTFFNRTIK